MTEGDAPVFQSFFGYPISLSPWARVPVHVTTEKIRTLHERLFTRPWHPLESVQVDVTTEWRPAIHIFSESIVAHADAMLTLERAGLEQRLAFAYKHIKGRPNITLDADLEKIAVVDQRQNPSWVVWSTPPDYDWNYNYPTMKWSDMHDWWKAESFGGGELP